MATIDVIRERPPIDFRSSGGGGGEGNGPHDQTPIKPTHPAEVGTGLALVRGPGGEMRKEILTDITHADLLAWGRAAYPSTSVIRIACYRSGTVPPWVSAYSTSRQRAFTSCISSMD
jgi:hypothetical protein